MIALDELNLWKKLSSPYGNSEEIPLQILKLSKTYDRSIADELIWEYIYHQGSVYESTLATVPHLIKIIEDTKDIEFKLDLISSLGVVLIDLDEIIYLAQIFQVNKLEEKEKLRIQTAFIDSLKKFKKLVTCHIPNTDLLDEESKRFYLIAFLVTIKKHKEAEVFKTFSTNDEYIFVCPNCEEETFLWNENNILKAYNSDPVFNDDQVSTAIELNNNNINLEWLVKPINEIKVNSLSLLIEYFKGNITCHQCHMKSNVFDGVMNSI